MPYDAQVFPAARQAHWPCATQTNRVTSLTSVTSVCNLTPPAAPTLGGRRSVREITLRGR